MIIAAKSAGIIAGIIPQLIKIFFYRGGGNSINNDSTLWKDENTTKIEENLQNLENIKDNINDIGAIIKIDLSKKIVSNIKYNKNIIDKNFDLKKIDPKSGCWRKGLENIGATYYMNATLQCFAHIHEFVIFLKKDDQVRKVINEKKEGTTNLTTVFAELLQNLYPTSLKDMKKEKYYALINFKETISQMNSLFKGIQANDSKDLVNFIIMQLHDELKKANPNKNNNNKFNFKIK